MRFTRLNNRFPRKRAFITGAGSGLGLELARALGNDGWSLGIFDHNLERLVAAEGELGAAGVSVHAYPGDVTHADELMVAVNSFAATHDGLDVMINNAGVAATGSLMDVPLEDWRWAIDINLMGVIHGSRAAIPHLQRNGNGLLINIASAASFASAPGMIPYNTTKAAVVALSESLVGELRDIGTQVSVVMPSFFPTNLLESFRGSTTARARTEQLMRTSGYSAEQAAADLLTAAAGGRIHIVLPRSTRLIWILKRWAPASFLKRLLPFGARRWK